MSSGGMRDFQCLDSFQVVKNILPCFWAAMALRWNINKSSPKADLALQLSICPRPLHDCKNSVLRFNRKAVLTGVEAEQFWCRLRSFDVKTQAFTYRRISVVSSILWVWQWKLYFVSASLHAHCGCICEITCLLAVRKEKSAYCLSCSHFLI